MVSVITCTMRQESLRNVFNNYDRQKWSDKELIIIVNKNDMSVSRWIRRAERYDNVTIYKLPEQMTLGKCLNFAIEKAKYSYIAKFDDDDYYGANYLIQAMRAFQETDADIVGKKDIYVYMEAIQAILLRTKKEISGLGGPTLVFKKEVWDRVKWPTSMKTGSDTSFKKQCLKHGFKFHSTDTSNFVYVRKADPMEHTWTISNEEYLKKCYLITYTKRFKRWVDDLNVPN
ncbi:glycosyltransferase [Paenibacillus sp. GCM10028914]|uniref:glycosyltransferase n=1 Tax=Paenibacillus sp. GCM10028914 TaxID=3273416 RepID=UPI00362355F7